MIDIIAQILSIFGMVCIVSSFQMKNKKVLLTVYLSGNILFSVSYFMLGAPTAGLLNGICGIMALVNTQSEKIKKRWVVNVIFYILFTTSYVLSFTVFDTPRIPSRFIQELLPLISMYIMTISFSMQGSAVVRRLGLINSPLWLIYNILVFSIGGIICECISLCSIILGIIRHDIKKKEK